MFFIQEVGGLVQQKDIRLLEEQLCQDYLCPLPAADLPDGSVKTHGKQPQPFGHFLNLCIYGIKVMDFQLFLAFCRMAEALCVSGGRFLIEKHDFLFKLI